MLAVTEGPPEVYVPILRVPWMFPHLPGISGYRREMGNDMRPLCLVTGKRIDSDPNSGKAADAAKKE